MNEEDNPLVVTMTQKDNNIHGNTLIHTDVSQSDTLSVQTSTPLKKKPALIGSVSWKTSSRPKYLWWIIIALSVAVFIVFCVALFVYVCTTMKGLEAYIEERVKQEVALALKDRPSSCKNGSEDIETQTKLHESYRSKRKAENKSKSKNKKRRRKKRNRNSSPVFVHLPGRNPTESHDVCPDADECMAFKWGGPVTQMGLNHIQIHPPRDPHEIRIRSEGLYLVYAQIAVDGKRGGYTEASSFSCAHEVVLTNGTGSTVLLKSHVTQDNLGRPILPGIESSFYPLDTKLVMGVFYLYRGYRLSVRIPNHCIQNQNYETDPLYSYFGVAKLH